MKIMDRYLLREYVLHLTYCILAFGMILVIWDLFDHMGTLLEARPPTSVVLRYYGSLLIVTTEYLFPAAMLLSTLYTLWQLSHNSELAAMRASGVSLYRIIAPFVAIGILASVGTGLIKEFVAPDAAMWVRRTKAADFVIDEEDAHSVDLTYVDAEDNIEWRIHFFDPLNPEKLVGVEIFWNQPGDPTLRRHEVRARRAEWLDGEWWFYVVKELDYSEHGLMIGGRRRIEGGDNGTQVPGINQEPRDFVVACKPAEFMSARGLHTFLKNQPHLPGDRRAEKETEMHSRLALPWACLILTLFGIPAGGRSSRQGIVIVVLAAVGMLLGFYAVTIVGLFLGKRGIIEPWLAAWFSNIVFLVAGMFMLRRMR